MHSYARRREELVSVPQARELTKQLGLKFMPVAQCFVHAPGP
jgi:hypothetical protein